MWVAAGRSADKMPTREDIERIDPNWRAAVLQWDTIYEWLGDTDGWRETVERAKEAEWKRRQQ